MQTFKGIFPAGSVPKGKSLTLVRSADGHLHVEYEGRVLGHVHDKWMADNLIQAYFGDYINPISPAVSQTSARTWHSTDPQLRDSAAEGFTKYAE